MKYVIAVASDEYGDPLNRGTQYSRYDTVLEVENWLRSAKPGVAEKSVVYQRVPVEYRGPSVIVKSFEEPKKKK